MKRRLTLMAAAGLAIAHPAFAQSTLVISQIYGGGGLPGSTYNRDYVELFNEHFLAQSIGGRNLQYGNPFGPPGLGSCNHCLLTFPQGLVIQPCAYYLIALGPTGPNGAPLPVAPDLDVSTSVFDLGTTAGSLALATNPWALACFPVEWEDLVGYGATGNCSNGLPAGAPSMSSAVVRRDDGVVNTRDNRNDFIVVSNAVPHNSLSATNPSCQTVGVESKAWSHVKQLYH